MEYVFFFFFFSSRRRHTRFDCDWSSDVCSSDLDGPGIVSHGSAYRDGQEAGRIAQQPDGNDDVGGENSESSSLRKERLKAARPKLALTVRGVGNDRTVHRLASTLWTA